MKASRSWAGPLTRPIDRPTHRVTDGEIPVICPGVLAGQGYRTTFPLACDGSKASKSSQGPAIRFSRLPITSRSTSEAP